MDGTYEQKLKAHICELRHSDVRTRNITIVWQHHIDGQTKRNLEHIERSPRSMNSVLSKPDNISCGNVIEDIVTKLKKEKISALLSTRLTTIKMVMEQAFGCDNQVETHPLICNCLETLSQKFDSLVKTRLEIAFKCRKY